MLNKVGGVGVGVAVAIGVGSCRCWSRWRRSAVTGVKGVDEGTARVVVACRRPGDDVGSLAVGGEARARIGELVETEHPNPGVPNSWVFHWQDDAPEFMRVLRAGGENEAGVIERVGAAHDELGIERINDRPIDVAVDGGVPALRAIGVERKELDQILPEVVGAIAPNIGRRENIGRVWCLEGPKQVAIGRKGRECGSARCRPGQSRAGPRRKA